MALIQIVLVLAWIVGSCVGGAWLLARFGIVRVEGITPAEKSRDLPTLHPGTEQRVRNAPNNYPSSWLPTIHFGSQRIAGVMPQIDNGSLGARPVAYVDLA